jgi:hypothetical protein
MQPIQASWFLLSQIIFHVFIVHYPHCVVTSRHPNVTVALLEAKRKQPSNG